MFITVLAGQGFRRLALIALSLLIVATVTGRAEPSVSVAQAPTAPILLVLNSGSSNPFGQYLGEILRTEGITAFDTAQLSGLTQAQLATYSMVILTETSLTAAQATLFANYASGGGSLIAMRPDAQLAGTFGITRVGTSTTADGYFKATTHQTSTGLNQQTLQIHGVADNYTLSGATEVAELYSSATADTSYPAVVVRNVGTGRAAAFTYDLARSVALTRQGNPAWAGTDHDGDGVRRTIDAFSGWVNLDRVTVPQADEQQRLLRNLITYFGTLSVPIPQYWYFAQPSQKSVLIVTGDDHGQASSRFQDMANAIAGNGGRMTFFLSRWGFLSSAVLNTLRGQGHEFGVHPYGQQDGQSLSAGYTQGIDWFTGAGYGQPSQTVRNHQVEWQGWAGAATVAQANGIELSTDFYHWGQWLRKPNSGPWVCAGYPTGSGQPMKHVDESGNIIPVYQQVTQLVDEQMISGAGAGYCGYSQAQAITESQQLIDRSIAGDYAAVTAQVHVDYYMMDWLAGLTDYAQQQGVPIWTAQRWLDFTRARQSAIMDQVTWTPATKALTFCARVSGSEPSVTLLLPASYGGTNLTTLMVDGQAVSSTALSVKGMNYRAFTIASGNRGIGARYQAGSVTSSDCGPSPTPTATSAPAQTATATATVTNTPVPGATATFTPTLSATATPQPITSQQIDTTVNDFNACVVPSGLLAAQVGDGELRRAATFEDYFTDATDPARWAWGSWSGGSYAPSPSGGLVVVQGAGGAWLRSQSTYTQRAVEGRVTFGSGAWQHIGFADEGFGSRYAILSTASDGQALRARTAFNGGAETTTQIPAAALDVAHDVRIAWDASKVDYFVDGALVASHPVAVTEPMYVYASNNGSAPLSVDWLRVASYTTESTTFVSCIKDGGATGWGPLTWTASAPAGTTLTVETHTSANGTTWSAWTAVSNGGTPANGTSRYLQYRLNLGTTDAQQSPAVQDVTVRLVGAPTPTPTATATALPVATATATSTSAATATPSAPTATPNPVSGQQIDSAVADFAACVVPSGLMAAAVGDGELRLTAILEDYFSGAIDPARWAAGTWSGGTFTPAPTGGVLTVQGGNGAWLRSQSAFTQRTLEGRITLGAGPWQHVGFADDGFMSRYAMLSTGSDGSTMLARTAFNGSAEIRTAIPAALGTAHDVRIVWDASKIDYYVDGALAASHSIAVTEFMYVYASNNGGAALTLDWLRVASYTTGSASFASCIKDAGAAGWGPLSWTASAPSGTTLTAETRTSPDGSAWSAWTAVTNGGIPSSATARYLQYRLTFATTDARQSPSVQDVTVRLSGVPTPTNTATPTSTATATLPPTSTPSGLPTATPKPVSGQQTDTLTADFGACVLPSGLTVAAVGDGELRRAASLEDYFTGPTDPARWAWGTWNGGSYAPTPANGSVVVQGGNGAWLRSQATFTQRTLEGRVTLGSGPWQHVGFADGDFASRYAMLSTGSNGSTLLARTVFAGGSESTTAIGAALGAAHDVRIVWRADRIDYYVDGALGASHAIAITEPMHVYASNNGGSPLALDWLRVAAYQTGSTGFVSCVKDAGIANDWGVLDWVATTPGGTTLTVETRTSEDSIAWTPWAAATSGAPPATATGRYLQYRATLATSNVEVSPELQSLTVRTVVAPTPTLMNTPGAMAASTFTPTPTPTNTPGAMATSTFTPTATRTPEPTSTLTPTATNTAAATNTPVPTATPTGTAPVAQTVSIAVNDVSILEGDSGTVTAVFTVSLGVAAGQPVTVQYATAGGSAAAGADFQPVNGTLTFQPGETGKVVPVTVICDTINEPDETFTVTLANPKGGATLGRAQGIGTIRNDDPVLPCSPRPRVRADSQMASQQLQVTISASPLNTGAPNALSRIRFGELRNAQVMLNGQPVVPGQSVTLPPSTQALAFTVQRTKNQEAATAFFTVVDGCGDWQTFAGMGAGS